jgi:monoamine oxidase
MKSRGILESEEVDVIIVGVGPTGATLAGLLAQRGVRVAAFELSPQPGVRAADGRSCLLDEVTGSRVRVVVTGQFSEADIAMLVAATRPLEGCIVSLSRHNIAHGCIGLDELEPVYSSWLARLEQRIAVVRPDQ